MGLISELRRRNVLRMAVLYAIAAWLIMQVAEVIMGLANLADWIGPTILGLLAVGFPIALIFSWFYELTPEGISLEKDVDRAESITHVTGRRLDFIVISLLCAAVILFAYDKWWMQGPPEKSIAVLPFENMSGDPGQEYFSDGLAEELLNLLARIPELRVTSRSSAFFYKGKKFKIADVGRELNVGHILEGSVRRSGDTVRITAQLIDVTTDAHLWSQTWDRTFDDIFVIQDEIAEAVVDALKISLLGDTPRALETTPEAYALYLQSRSLAAQRTADSLLQAETLTKRALEMDNEYAPAWVQLANIYTVGAAVGSWHPNEAYPLARAAAMEALRLDANNAAAHATLSSIARGYDYDLETARAEQQLASTLAPGNSVIRASAADLAMLTGDYDEAIRLGEEAALGDPLNLETKLVLGFGYFYAGRIDEAMSVFREMFALNPFVADANIRLGQALLISGDYDAALEEMNKGVRDGHRLAGRALVFQAMGDSEGAATELDELIALGYTWTYEIAMVHAYRGELDEAFTWLDRAIDRHDTSLILILGDPFMDNLREDPRFDAVLERLGHKAP
jgi:TolB-like protein